MKRATYHLLGFAAIAFVVAGCNPIYTNHDYDPAVDFTQYKTYSWMEAPQADPQNASEARQQSSLIAKRVRSEVGKELADKGFTAVEIDGDVLVVYYLGAKEFTEITGSAYGRGDLYANMFVGGGSYSAQEVTEGNIIIDMVDRNSDSAVWRGSAEVAMKAETSTEKRYEILDNAIKKIFEKYPPKK